MKMEIKKRNDEINSSSPPKILSLRFWHLDLNILSSMDFQLQPYSRRKDDRLLGRHMYSIRFVQFELSAVDMPQNERTEKKSDREGGRCEGKRGDRYCDPLGARVTYTRVN